MIIQGLTDTEWMPFLQGSHHVGHAQPFSIELWSSPLSCGLWVSQLTGLEAVYIPWRKY